MKNIFQKIPLIISIILLLLLCFIFVFLYTQTSSNNKKAELGGETWQSEAQKSQEIASLDSSLKENAPLLALLDTHFVESSNVVPFLDSIEGLAPQSGVAVEIDSADTGANGGGLTVGLKATGSFTAVYKFLTLLENSPYELNFLSVDMNKLAAADPGARGSSWEAVFKIQLLSFVP